MNRRHQAESVFAYSLAWIGLTIVVLAAVAACRSDPPTAPTASANPEPTAAVGPPPAVPPDARLVDTNLFSSGQTLVAMMCADGLLTIVTTREQLFVELPCDRALPESDVQRYLAQAVELDIRIQPPANKLILKSAVAGSVEFTTARIWRKN